MVVAPYLYLALQYVITNMPCEINPMEEEHFGVLYNYYIQKSTKMTLIVLESKDIG